MPYITQKARTALLAGRAPVTFGEANFLLCEEIRVYLGDQKSIGYSVLADLLGFLRVFVSPDNALSYWHPLSEPFNAVLQKFDDVSTLNTEEKFIGFVGVITSIEFEIYRRMVAPYEDIKLAENGDVRLFTAE